MIGAFLGLWTKLRSRPLLLGTYGAIAAAVVLITAVVVSAATDGDSALDGAPGPPGVGLTPAAIQASDGQLLGLANAAVLLGIVAVVVAAGQVAGEHSTGTLRNVLVRQPRRLRLLVGWWGALVTFVGGGVLVGGLLAGVTAQIAAAARGFDTSEWYTAAGIGDSAGTLGLTALAAAGYATVGMVLGVVLRSPIPAIGIGVGWLLAVETALANFVDGLDRWLPGQLLSAIAAGGTDSIALTRAAVTAIAYVAAGGLGAAALFVRRDVTA